MKTIIIFCILLLISSTSGLIFECNFRVQYWTYVNFLYTCEATIVNTTNPRIIEDIRGDHMDGKVNQDVRGFLITSQTLNQIPENISDFFPEIQGFICVDANLLTLDSNDLKQFPNLTFFRVMENKIISLDQDVFIFNPNLHYIDFDTNLLENVGLNLLDHLQHLEEADFSNNSCISKNADRRELVEELMLQLPILCPPLPEPSTTTEQPICYLRCSLEDEVDELKDKLTLEVDLNQEQSELIEHLEAERIEQSKRIDELEKKIDSIIG
jgi:hypothetical protein